MRLALAAALVFAMPVAAEESRDGLLAKVANCRLPQEACKSYADSQKGSGRVSTPNDPVQMTRLSWRVLDWAETILTATGAADCEAAQGTMVGPILETDTHYFAVTEVREQGRPRCFVADLGAKG